MSNAVRVLITRNPSYPFKPTTWPKYDKILNNRWRAVLKNGGPADPLAPTCEAMFYEEMIYDDYMELYKTDYGLGPDEFTFETLEKIPT